jgi:F420-dependent oxidoreductase-like protein
MIEPQQGITWPDQVALARRAEEAGFEALYRADHYESLPGQAGRPTSDGWAAIAGLTALTTTLRHGTLVSPVTFRHPGNIAKVVATIDEIGNGRVELGLGAGWHEQEHRRHGFAFPPLETRLEMLEEQLQVVAGLWAAEPGWGFAGSHYTVEDAIYSPHPVQHPRPPLIVGTMGKPRAIRMAARYADHLNIYYCTVEMATEAFLMLDQECRRIGRALTDIRRSVLLGTVVGEDRARWQSRRDRILRTFEYGEGPERWQREHEGSWISGLLDDASRTIEAYAAAGADTVIFQDFLPDDSDMIDLLGALARTWRGHERD